MASPTLPLHEMLETLRMLQAFAISFIMLWLAVFPFVLIGVERCTKHSK